MRYGLMWAGAAALALVAGGGMIKAQVPKTPEAGKAAVPKDAKPASVVIVQPWARATPGGAKVGGAFLEIQNKGAVDDKLLSASSPIAAVVELHDHIRDGGVMKMRRVDTIPVGAGKSVTLKPGGLHLMLLELKDALKDGEMLDLVLTFEKAGVVQVKAPILKLGTMGAPADAGSGSGSEAGSGSGSGSGSGAGSTK